ncbi:hypothetical protein ACFWY5_29570 [Nonomuraea sp. NPDC059007]|uniref:hypothetical protein n=1 Tax=Nonomuraea sp. NPDC059007 TaxID=3346692 RepID=UPI0036BAAD46
MLGRNPDLEEIIEVLAASPDYRAATEDLTAIIRRHEEALEAAKRALGASAGQAIANEEMKLSELSQLWGRDKSTVSRMVSKARTTPDNVVPINDIVQAGLAKYDEIIQDPDATAFERKAAAYKRSRLREWLTEALRNPAAGLLVIPVVILGKAVAATAATLAGVKRAWTNTYVAAQSAAASVLQPAAQLGQGVPIEKVVTVAMGVAIVAAPVANTVVEQISVPISAFVVSGKEVQEPVDPEVSRTVDVPPRAGEVPTEVPTEVPQAGEPTVQLSPSSEATTSPPPLAVLPSVATSIKAPPTEKPNQQPTPTPVVTTEPTPEGSKHPDPTPSPPPVVLPPSTPLPTPSTTAVETPVPQPTPTAETSPTPTQSVEEVLPTAVPTEPEACPLVVVACAKPEPTESPTSEATPSATQTLEEPIVVNDVDTHSNGVVVVGPWVVSDSGAQSQGILGR